MSNIRSKSIPDNGPPEKRKRAGNEGMAPIPSGAAPLLGHFELGAAPDPLAKFAAAPQIAKRPAPRAPRSL